MSFPAFVGFVGQRPDRMSEAPVDHDWELVCESKQPPMMIWCRRAGLRNCCSWTSDERDGAAVVFVWGEPLFASDCEFDAHTKIERAIAADLPRRICHLYKKHGKGAFALLEGSFCLAIADPSAQTVFLVSDKFGCEDICVRKHEGGFAFASDASLLTDSTVDWNPLTIAFFLAQEGFVPAPFTLFEDVRTVGRARYLRISLQRDRIIAESGRYWVVRERTKLSRGCAEEMLGTFLKAAIEQRQRATNGILLSGGIDSALLTNMVAETRAGEVASVTGAIRGHLESESEVESARKLSRWLGIPHYAVYIDAEDEELPAEWVKCCASWTGGTRITLAMFYRFAVTLQTIFGCGYGAFSGQMADTLADNNYTVCSPGYAVRRMFFSPQFLRLMPVFHGIASLCRKAGREFLGRLANAAAGERARQMLRSVFDGLQDKERFYAGRVFGFGEMPGWNRSAFPPLSDKGFEAVADWYTSQFVAPIVSPLEPATFYEDMMELSLDMCMLHLDTRLVVHALRLGGGCAELPFLDSRVVGLFAALPDSARAPYRRPKNVIRRQFKRRRYQAPLTQAHPRRSLSSNGEIERSGSFEEALLRGSLGSYFREMLGQPDFPGAIQGACELLDEDYCERQRKAFLRGDSGVDYRFISRLASLELWARQLRRAPVMSYASSVA